MNCDIVLVLNNSTPNYQYKIINLVTVVILLLAVSSILCGLTGTQLMAMLVDNLVLKFYFCFPSFFIWYL